MTAQAIPFFCSDCDSQFKSASDAHKQKDGRVICTKCRDTIKRKAESKRQGALFEEQKSLFNPDNEQRVLEYIRKHPGASLHDIAHALKIKAGDHTKPLNQILIKLRDSGQVSASDNQFGPPRFKANPCRVNVEGYTDATGFHPIRASKDYNEFLAGDFEPTKAQKRKTAKEKSDWEAKELAQVREDEGIPKKSLASYVRSLGGIVPGGMYAGEIRRLSYKDTGTTGLINQHARQGRHKQTAEYVMDSANAEGYRDRHGERFTSIGDFLLAVEDSAVKGIDHFRKRGDTAKQKRAKQEKRYMTNPKTRSGAFVVETFNTKDSNAKWNLVRDTEGGKTSYLSESEANKLARRIARQMPQYKTRVIARRTNPRGKPRRCDCENTHCKVAHRLGACPNRASVDVTYGKVCNACAKFIPKEYRRNPSSFGKLDIARNKKAAQIRAKGEALINKAFKLRLTDEKKAKKLYDQGHALVIRARRSGEQSEGPIGKLPNPYVGIVQGIKNVRSQLRQQALLRELGKTQGAIQAQKDALLSLHEPMWSDVPKARKRSEATHKAKLTDLKDKEKAIISELKTKKNPLSKHVQLLTQMDQVEKKRFSRGAKLPAFCEECGQPFKEKDLIYYWPRVFIAVHRKHTTRKQNPSVKEMSERFQGRANGGAHDFKASNSAPSNLARAGKLVFLKLQGGKQVRIPGAMVAIDAAKEKLWIVGNRTPLFTRKAANANELLDYGEIAQICYETAKAHIGEGKRFEYVHTFGEDGGKRPRLLIDHEGMPILRGGSYTIKAEGIVN